MRHTAHARQSQQTSRNRSGNKKIELGHVTVRRSADASSASCNLCCSSAFCCIATRSCACSDRSEAFHIRYRDNTSQKHVLKLGKSSTVTPNPNRPRQKLTSPTSGAAPPWSRVPASTCSVAEYFPAFLTSCCSSFELYFTDDFSATCVLCCHLA